MADAYLPVVVGPVPVEWLIGDDGRLTANAIGYARQGVLRVIAGPLEAIAVIDIRRPYNRPPKLIEVTP